MADRLAPLDAAFLELEEGDESSHMHVGWAMVFDPIFAGHAVGVAAVSYDGEVTFGLNADRARVPDLEVLELGIEESLAELRGLAGAGAAPGAAPGRAAGSRA